jgi:hypothetical protein
MAIFLQRNEIDFERTGITVNVPDNDVARLMYYLKCVCMAIEYEQDSDIQRFTNYNNWAYLSIEEQWVLYRLCCKLNPDLLENRCFLHNEDLCGNSRNDFLEISQVRQQFLVADSIVIAGQTRMVKNVMVYKMEWRRDNYLYPMRRLPVKLDLAQRPALSYQTTTYGSNTYGSTHTPIVI